MSIELDLLRYVGLYIEPSRAAYGVDHSGTPGDFLAVPYQEGSLKMQALREELDPKLGKMLADGHDLKVHGKRSNTVELGITLHSHGVDTDGNNTVPDVDAWALGALLKATMGGVYTPPNPGTPAQTTVQAGSTATVINVTTGHGARFIEGGAIAVPIASGSSILEAREILDVTGDAVTVKVAFSGVPATGNIVRGAMTFYLAEDPQTTLQFLVEGREANDATVYCGVAGGFSFDKKISDLGMLKFQSQLGSYWARLNSGVTVPTYVYVGLMAGVANELIVATVGSTTRSVIPQSSSTFEPQVTYAPIISGSGVETIAGARRQASRPVIKGSFTTALEDETFQTSWDSRTTHAIFEQWGWEAGHGILFSAPSVQIVNRPLGAAETGISGQMPAWEGRHDQALYDGSTERLNSAFRIHFW